MILKRSILQLTAFTFKSHQPMSLMTTISFHPQNLLLKALVAMATSGYSEDLQPQQANAVTIATAAATPPSATKTAHFLSEIPPAPGSIVSASQSAAPSKTVPANPNANAKAVVLTSPTPHYVTPDIQHSAAQKSNGQSSSPQYIIVTVTGERLADD